MGSHNNTAFIIVALSQFCLPRLDVHRLSPWYSIAAAYREKLEAAGFHSRGYPHRPTADDIAHSIEPWLDTFGEAFSAPCLNRTARPRAPGRFVAAGPGRRNQDRIADYVRLRFRRPPREASFVPSARRASKVAGPRLRKALRRGRGCRIAAPLRSPSR
jgi:hypothetical protein